ncbi:Zn(2)-C6 fungal-type domain-containing protein [Fusarium sp. Ph1]|nr:Zn(2)-C6 fungal-type domain-containing protein [Fusarium sp. Ph1]
MVNVPGRSRGCATCRKRRVKCDESLPECLACVRMGLPCPGARTGTFFVHAVPRPSSSHGTCSSTPRLPGPQPSRASAFDQLFVSHFVESFFGTMKPPPTPTTPSKIWLHELPVFLASQEPSSAQPAIRAASMISYGTLTGDVSIKTAARKWYAEALHHLQCRITKGNVAVDESIICAVVMLIHFETWAGTSQKAWLRHLKGAAMLLQVAGPESCRDGFMHQIFSHLRFQMFVAAMTENEVPVFASQDWMTVPFQVYPKLIFDQLIDVLFNLLKCLSVADQLIKPDSSGNLRSTLDALIRDSMLQASQWWSGCIENSPFGQVSPKQGCGPDEGQLLRTYTSVPAAALCSLYDAANMITFRLLHLVSSSAPSHDLNVRQHAESILSASHFIDEVSGPAPDRGSIMITLQLKVVSLWSPSSEQRNMALALLQRDKHRGGGLSDIATVSHEYFADVAAYILQHYPSE